MTNKHIYLAGGCFWGTEHFFKQIAGVVETEVGFANGQTSLQLAGDNEQYWKIYGLNCLVFTELAARAQGKTQRNPNPLMK